MWGCPSFVSDLGLQDGGHMPRFGPKSRSGLHLGWSPLHISTDPLVLKLVTGNVFPQFCAVFDNWFSTVNSDGMFLEDDIKSER